MSLEQYHDLLSASQESFGVQLPELHSAQLELDAKLCSIEETLQVIQNFDATHGWVMYRDSVEITTIYPTRKDIIEAEYSNGVGTLMIKHIQGVTYRVTSFNLDLKKHSDTQCFKSQSVYVRNNLQGDAARAIYRLWYQQDDYRWKPFAQQFIGFSKEAK